MLTLELVTISGLKFSEDVAEVIVPTPQGYIAVYDNHSNLVSTVVPGVISIRKHKEDADEKLTDFAVDGGVIEVTSNRTRILVDEADSSEEVSEEKAKQALEVAQRMAKESKDSVDIDKALSQIQVQQARLKIAELKRLRRK